MDVSEKMESVGNTTEKSTDIPSSDELGIELEHSMTSDKDEMEESKESKEGSGGEDTDDKRSSKHWSELLQSPRGTECFSPSLDLSKPDCLHGIGTYLVTSHRTPLQKSMVFSLLIRLVVRLSLRNETSLFQIQIYWRSRA